MMDIMVLALWSDTTRIGTFMTADAQTNEDFSFLPGVKGGIHSLSHHAEEPVRKKQYETIVTWHVEQVAYFLNKLKSLDEGGTSLLDNSMVMFGCGIKCGNLHLEENLPIALAGGGKGTLRPGRRLRAAKRRRSAICTQHAASHGDPGRIVRGQHGPLQGLA